MVNLKDKITDAATSLSDGASGVAEDLQSRAKDAWDSLQYESKRAVRKSSAYVSKNAVPAALATFGIGLVLGLFLSRRVPARSTNHASAAPLHRTRGVLTGLLIACGILLKRTFSEDSIVAEEIPENGGDAVKHTRKPLRRATRQTGRKLGV